MMTLQKARELAGLSQLELDREADLPKGTTNDIENGRNSRPAAAIAIQLVRALRRRGLPGVSVEELFGPPEADAAPARRRAAAR